MDECKRAINVEGQTILREIVTQRALNAMPVASLKATSYDLPFEYLTSSRGNVRMLTKPQLKLREHLPFLKLLLSNNRHFYLATSLIITFSHIQPSGQQGSLKILSLL